MTSYIIRRLLLMFPTLIGIITITFIATQFVPGGPIDQMKSLLMGHGNTLTEAGGNAMTGEHSYGTRHKTKIRLFSNLFSSTIIGKGFWFLNLEIHFIEINPFYL